MGLSAARFESAGVSTKHYIPGVYSRRNTVGTGTGISAGNLCILGTSMGGEPRVLLEVADKAEAKNLLLSGTLLEGVAHAFAGSSSYIPEKVYCMRVNAGTQSATEFKSGDDVILRATSADFGSHTNQIKRWLKKATDGTYTVLVNYKGEEEEVSEIGKDSLSILYTGTGTMAECTVNSTGLTLASDVEDERLDVTWEECETVEELVSRINDTGNYAATLIDTASGALSEELDHVSSASVYGTAATFTSNLQALIDALEGISYIGSVELASTSRVMPDTDTGYVYFTGGEAGTSTVSDWADAIDELEKYDIQIIATPSTDADIRELILNHCEEMCSVNKKKERTCWLGAPSGTSISNAVTIAKNLNSEFCSFVATGANANNPITGTAEDISPGLLACKCAGIEAAIAVSTPLTNKEISVNSFDARYTQKEMETMIQAGLVPFAENEEGDLVCIRSMTTYQGDSLIQNERSMIRSVLYMDRDLRQAFFSRIGTSDEPSESSIIQTLNDKAKEWYASNLLTKSDSGELVMNAKVSFDADKAYLTFDRYIRAPNNFVFITATNQVYSSTVEV